MKFLITILCIFFAVPVLFAEATDLLTMAEGATVANASTNKELALDLINGDLNDHRWRNNGPKDPLPYELVFELRAPTVLESIAVDTTIQRPGGAAGAAAKVIDIFVSSKGPDADFKSIGTIEVAEDSSKSISVPAAEAVRWIKFTIRENHGNPNWTYLDEVLAFGKQEKVSDEDGRFTGKFATNFGPIEMTQTANQISGCYDGGHLMGSVSGGVARLNWNDSKNPKVFGTALFVIDSKGHLTGVRYRQPGRAVWFGPPATEKDKKAKCPPLTASNPISEALTRQGRIILYGIHFDFDSDVLKPESEPVLNFLLEALKSNESLSVDIEGHTDIIGSDVHNLDLSKRRAQSVVKWLAARGIAESRLEFAGKGKTQPVADNETADGRALNRRVEIVKRP